jgi:hypothetical protein
MSAFVWAQLGRLYVAEVVISRFLLAAIQLF